VKIAIISDMHLGYARFEEDSFTQAEAAFLDADGKADCIICAGDVFDIKIPKLETIKRAVEIFEKVKIPVFAIHGNHERRSKDLTNPVQLLATAGTIDYLHGTGRIFEKDGEKAFILGIGSVPEEYALTAIKKCIEEVKEQKTNDASNGQFRVLVLHQMINENHIEGQQCMSVEDLDGLPFDLIINGHIHDRKQFLDGRLIIPGSTVVTQLKKEETEPRGYIIFDTKTKKSEFVETKHRKFFFGEIELKDAGLEEAKNAVSEKVLDLRAKDSEAIIRIKLAGKMREGINAPDFSSDFGLDRLLFIDNTLDSANIRERIERIKKNKDEKLSVREVALKSLENAVSGKVSLFDPHELFEKLCIGVDEAEEYLKEKK